MLITALSLLIATAAPTDSAVGVVHPIHTTITAPAYVAVGSDTAAVLLARGQELELGQRYQAARRFYHAAARLRAAKGESPASAMRHVVDTYFYSNDLAQAAVALDAVAATAAEYGDVAGQAEALVDAACVYGRMGDHAAVEDRRVRALRLINSPNVPVAAAELLRARLAQ